MRTYKNSKLDSLIEKGLIKSYHYKTVEEDPGSGTRESEELILTFNEGTELKLTTICSGIQENTYINIE